MKVHTESYESARKVRFILFDSERFIQTCRGTLVTKTTKYVQLSPS